MSKNLFKSRAKCPKCGSKDLIITETLRAATSVKQTNGYIDKDSSNNEYGSVYRLDGECCKCNHSWRFKKIIQVTSLIDNPQEY